MDFWALWGMFGQFWVLGAAQSSSVQCCQYKKVVYWVSTSAGTLLWIYRRLIGRSYIALARQDQYIGNISDPLRRLRS